MGTIFVGVPTFNRPVYLRETLDSLRAQTHGDWVALVSDNASAPEAAAAARALVESFNDPRIRFHAQPANLGEYGQGRTFQAAAAESGAEFFVILHDDDILHPGHLARSLDRLKADPVLAFHVGGADAIGASGEALPEVADWYRRHHGREGRASGKIDVLDTLMTHGLAPICGTVFRRSWLERSGFVDADLHGNFPFELNLFLRLGEIGCQAWFDPEPTISFRFHDGALRRSDRLMQNPQVVDNMITLFARRRFRGRPERRRRVLLARLHRARSILELRAGRPASARASLFAALAVRPFAPRAWLLRPGLLIAPRLLEARVSESEVANPPRPVQAPRT